MTALALQAMKAYRGSRRQRRRVGRGNSSRGTYSGRGMKGQRSRSGGRRGLIRRSLKALLERVPKQRGFRSRRQKFEVVNLRDLQRCFAAGDVVTPERLKEKGLIAVNRSVKVLGRGQIDKALQVRAHKFSRSAKAAIEQAGGTAVEFPVLPLATTTPPTEMKESTNA